VESFLSLQLPPGVRRAGTLYQSKGRWADANLVRWYQGILGPVGGWVPLPNAESFVTFDATEPTWDSTLQTFDAAPLAGIPRAAHGWRADDAARWIAVGTVGSGTTRLWVYSNGLLFDVTPIGIADAHADAFDPAGLYGFGPYGFGPYGMGESGTLLNDPDTWQLDNFGESLIAVCTADERLVIWQKNPFVLAQPLTSLPGASGVPTARGVVVTPERFVFALGAAGVQRRVQWASQESLTDWTAASTNSAGDFDLQTTGTLVAGRGSRRETLLWTDTDLHAALYIGGVLVYSFQRIGDNCGLMGPEAVAMAGGVAFWMSPNRRFFRYDGAVTPIDCDLFDFLDADLVQDEHVKVQAIAVTEFNEVWWFYPSVSQGGTENARYVAYNYAEDHWSLGILNRSAGISDDVFGTPMLCDPAGVIWQHETGNQRTPTPFVVSGPIEVGQGDQLAVLQRIIPDDTSIGEVSGTLYTSNYPTDPERQVPFTATQPTTLRVTARQIRIGLTEVTATDWRIGTYRLGLLPGSRR